MNSSMLQPVLVSQNSPATTWTTNTPHPTETGALLPAEDSQDTFPASQGTCADCPQSATPAANTLPIPNSSDAPLQHTAPLQHDPAQPLLPTEDSQDTFSGSQGTCADCPQSATPAANTLPIPNAIPNSPDTRLQHDPAQPVLPTEDSQYTFLLKPLNKEAPITKTRRVLPHWEQVGCTYFVTFRLADAVATPVWKQWRTARADFYAKHPKPWDAATQKDYNAQFPAQLERWTDAGHGSCALADPSLRALMVQTMHHFDGERYSLGDYVLMPNHAHVLVTPHEGHTLKDILSGWKRTSGHSILKRIPGPKPFWMDEDFDHAVRSEKQLLHFQNYIAENPAKAKLREGTWTHYQAK